NLQKDRRKKKHGKGTLSIIIQAGAALPIACTLIVLLNLCVLCVKFFFVYKIRISHREHREHRGKRRGIRSLRKYGKKLNCIKIV
ncbi:MAG: hypothetical protein AB1798_10355, partial [Spirochaetota bacterium]